jgi:hypothetical protein
MPIETVPGTSLKYYLVTFDASGNEGDESDGKISQKLLEVLANEPITDVFIFSHGWLADIPAARRQYNKWLGAMAEQKDDIDQIRQARPGFRPLLIGLHWPSMPWGDEELGGSSVSFEPSTVTPVEQLIDQYAERIADTAASRQALQTIFSAAMEDMAPPSLPPEVKDAYEVLNREAGLGSEGEGAAPGADREPFDPEKIYQAAEDELVSFGNGSFGSLLAPLRTLSYWKMKDRARQFGESGGYKLLEKLQKATDEHVRFHLMGHSFGCIVVSATLAGASGHGDLVRPVNSVSLLQGALSLWSYCSDIRVAPGRPGYFRSIIDAQKVAGPIITTQSELDTAVGKMYPLGAGIARQVHFAPGELPKYGALGTFGAQGDGLDIVSMKMLSSDTPYQYQSGKIYNLDGTEFICDTTGGGLGGAHSDIAKPEVAHAIWQAVLASNT